jgi:predicted nuclease with RNAse H fold
MLFKDSVFIGIDPSSGEDSLTYAVLDKDLHLLALSQQKLNTVSAFVGGQKSAVVGVNAPRRLNQGLMKQDAVRDDLKPQPSPGRYTAFRVAEYLLFQRNIRIPRTPAKISNCPGWIQVGFKLYRNLEEMGFMDFPAKNKGQLILEVYPHAAFTVLLERIPFLKKTLEGRLQRQLLLHSLSLPVPDPMLLFEEITRYKILRGELPLEGLHSVEELEALMAAYLAWKAASEPDAVNLLGDARDGQIVLPSKDLKPKYT